MTTTIADLRAEAARYHLPDVQRVLPHLPDAQARTLAQRRAETMSESALVALIERGRRMEARAPYEAKIRAANPHWPEHIVYAAAERALRRDRPKIDQEVRAVVGAAPVVPMRPAAKPKPAPKSTGRSHTVSTIARVGASPGARAIARAAKSIATTAHPRVAAASTSALDAAAARISSRREPVHIDSLERELARPRR